ncbi:MAG: hypothetical protein WCK37_01155 [Candidatus Falkowbacteria bacterium]
MTLYIDTAGGEEIFLSLSRGDIEIDAIRFAARHEQAEKLLPAIEKILKKNKSKLSSLKAIAVNNTGDSFTALRIGVVTANALAFALNISVSIKIPEGEVAPDSVKKFKNFSVVKPFYNREPNIG